MNSSNTSSLVDFYQKRADHFQGEADLLSRKYDQYSYVRLLAFIALMGLLTLLWSSSLWLGFIGTIIGLVVFYRFVIWHSKIKKNSNRLATLSKINHLETLAQKGDYQTFEDGQSHLDVNHPYCLDLDIFGPYSFFQYVNRTSTVLGNNRLADFFKTPTTPSKIKDKQAAIIELSTAIDWRQNLAAIGSTTQGEDQQLSLLRKWLKDNYLVLQNKWLKLAILLTIPWFLFSAILWAFFVSWKVFILLLLPQFIILKKTKEAVDEIHKRTGYAQEMLTHFGAIIKHIESVSFSSPLLKKTQGAFGIGHKTASSRIHRLSYIISQLNVRFNPFGIFLNIIGLWDLYWVKQLELWKEKEQAYLEDWFEAMADFEALSSIANLHFNHPTWVMPQFYHEALFKSKNLGHPLINKKDRVCNDIEIPLNGHIKLITGSNMAGKSTFLRTVGLNMVMAQAGCPVCATEFEMPFTSILTSMRTQDALHESTSSFYAELKRLKFIINDVEEAQKQQPRRYTFFLLDEILKGTNSVDRHTGSKALINQMIASGGSGIIATHDLELGAMEKEAKGAIENLCIEVDIKDEQLFFDYKLKKGVSKSFNATVLMRSMGIKV